MIVNIDRSGTVEGLGKIVGITKSHEAVEGLMILSCDANGFTPDSVNGVLRDCDTPLFGGVFPEIICGTEKLSAGTIVAGLTKRPEVRIINSLSDINIDYDRELDEKIPDSESIKTVFVFVDGFAKRINAFIESLFNIFGLEVNYIGGGAGSLSMQQKPCLLTNEGMLQDSGLVATVNMESGIGISHGWKKIKGPFRVTESDRNTIKTLDWSPAFEVYQKVVKKHSGQDITEDNFFDMAKKYPFGLSRLATDYIVRDPFKLEADGSLTCVGEVPQESFIYILNGDMSSLVKSASKAAAISRASFTEGQKPDTTLFIDCISRVLFLKEDFQQELKAVVDPGTELIGALTIGEIANSRKSYLEFYNKTAVVGSMGN